MKIYFKFKILFKIKHKKLFTIISKINKYIKVELMIKKNIIKKYLINHITNQITLLFTENNKYNIVNIMEYHFFFKRFN